MKARTLLISVLFFAFSCSDSVSKWEDQSGNGNDLTQSVEVNQPTIEKDSIQQLIDQEMNILKIQMARFDSLIEEGKAEDRKWMEITSNSINHTKENIKYLEGLK